MADIYFENNMPDLEFMSRLPWNYKDSKVNYHFKCDDQLLPCFLFEERVKHSYYMQKYFC